jgi:hypothetical protein
MGATVASLCVAAAGCGGGSGSSSSTPANAGPSGAFGTKEVPAGVIDGHQLFKPECLPVTGRRWVYPGPQIITSTKYEMFAINYPCALAKRWTQKLLQTPVFYKKGGTETVLQGPKGYYCSAWPDKTRHAYAGGCQKKHNGNKAFGWNWNVLHRRVVFDPDENGIPRLTKLMGADAQVVLLPKDGYYQLDVHNTTGIGSIDHFTWTPPPGWTVKEIRKTTGGACTLSANGDIDCKGKLRHPSCTCRGDGETLSVEFTAAVPPDTTKNGHPLLYGSAGARLRIKEMTPVPYLVPGSPIVAAKQKNV